VNNSIIGWAGQEPKMRTLTKYLFVLVSLTALTLSGLSCASGPGVGPAVASVASPAITPTPGEQTSPSIALNQVPESEMLHIIFSTDWILKNDVLPDPFNVKITFPSSWLTNAPAIPEGERPVELRVPIQLFNKHNQSQNQDEITVIFPTDYFIGLPLPAFTPGTPSPQLIREPPAINFFTKPGVNPPSKELKISAISGPLDWSLVADTPWLTISSTRGTASTEKEIVTVSVDASGLTAGLYSTTITFRQEGTAWFQDIPARLFVTSAQAGTLLNIPVVSDTGSAFEKGIHLEQANVSTAILEGAGQNGWSGGYFSAGDLCFLIRGAMRNDTDQDWLMHYYAYGYDADGNEISWTLDVDPGPLSGIVNMDIPASAASDFTLHLSWAENVTLIKIFANIYPQPK
jgi:hypothetical protein